MNWWKKVRSGFAPAPPAFSAQALLRAAEAGHVDRVRALLERVRTRAEIRAIRGTALLLAANNGHTAVAQALLFAEDDVKIDEDTITSVIIRAAIGGHDSIVELLARDYPEQIQSWFTQPAPVSSGEALFRAAEDGDAVLVRLLLAKDTAPKDRRTTNRGTALLLAAQHGHTSVAEALLSARGVPVVDKGAVTNAINKAAIGGHTAFIDLLARDHAPQFRNEHAALALWRAAEGGHSATVRALLRGGTPPDLRARGRSTALLAAAARDSACVAALLEMGADVRQMDSRGRTALHHASAANQEECVRLLVAAGADLSARDGAGLSASDLAPTELVRRHL